MGYERIGVINGFRGFAILAVIYHHLFSRLTPPGYGSIEIGGLTLLPFSPLANGWLGVNLFFVLSGFVLFAPYHANLRPMDTIGDVATFYRKRARRLLPLYFLVSLFGFIFVLQPPERTLSAFFLMATTTFPFTKGTFFPLYNGTLWSIGVEIWLSIAFPLLLLAYRRVGMWRVLVGTLILSMAVRIIGNDPEFYVKIPVLNFVKDSFLGRLDDLVLGMVIVCLYHRFKDYQVWEGWLFLCFLGGLAFLLATSSLWDYIQLEQVTRNVAPLPNTLFHCGCVLTLLSVLLTKNTVARFIFANPVIQLLGMMCYSLYVWHVWLIGRMAGPPMDQIFVFAILFPAITTLTYRYVEFGHVKETKMLFSAPRMR